MRIRFEMKTLEQRENDMLKTILENKSGFAWCLMLTFAVMLVPDMAAATGGGGGGGGSTIAKVLCNVVSWFNGPVGKGIATLAIIVIGVGALMGKVSWGMAIIVGVGVAVIFGADTVVDELASGGAEGDVAGCDGAGDI